MISWSLAEMLISLIGYEIEDWRKSLLWFVGVPAILLNFGFFAIYESPK